MSESGRSPSRSNVGESDDALVAGVAEHLWECIDAEACWSAIFPPPRVETCRRCDYGHNEINCPVAVKA